MATKTYVDYSEPAIDADWLNDVDRLQYDILGNPATDAEVITNLGITATAAELNVLDGITATVAELNILDGVTSTAIELNYVDGVTSAIQTQIDSKVTSGGALGTPSSGVLTNCTGLPVSTGMSGLGTGVATFLATPSSANLIYALTDETGTGAAVFATSPTLVTPALGTPASGDLSNCTSNTESVGNNSTQLATTAFCEAGFVNNDVGFDNIGSFCLAGISASNTAITAGGTYAGSGLTRGGLYLSALAQYAAITHDGGSGTLTGTWRCILPVVAAGTGLYSYTLFQRIS